MYPRVFVTQYKEVETVLIGESDQLTVWQFQKEVRMRREVKRRETIFLNIRYVISKQL